MDVKLVDSLALEVVGDALHIIDLQNPSLPEVIGISLAPG
jgi:hypothetical protein